MVDLYYNNDTTDGQWDTIGNWWLDLAYTLPAATYGLPQAGDNVFIDNELSAGPVVPVALNAIECGFYNSSSSFNVNLGGATTTTYNFYNNVTHTGTTVVGSYNFRDNSTNSGTVDSNNISSGFFDNSQNTGSAANAAGFSGSAANSGTCGSDASFSDNSLTSGTVLGNATFNDNSYNSGTVVGNATFNTFTDLGDGEYEDTVGYGIGTVNGDVAGSGSQFYTLKYLNNGMSGSIIATTDPFTVEFRNSTFNTGVIDLYDGYRVSYYDNSYNAGTVSGDVDFFNFSYNIGTVSGDATFSDSSYNSGTVSGDVTFSDSSYNSGTVSGDATFNYLTVTDGIVDDTTGYSSGIVGGVVYGASSTVITTWRFSGDLLNAATCDGDAIFNGDDFGNSGIITGDASFYNGSFNSGTVQGTTFIYDDSRNTGTVEDIVYKSAEAARLAIQNSYIGTINGTVSLPFADILGTGLQ